MLAEGGNHSAGGEKAGVLETCMLERSRSVGEKVRVQERKR